MGRKAQAFRSPDAWGRFLRNVVRDLAAILVVVVSTLATTACQADPLIFDYRGFHVDLSGARGTMPDVKMIAAIKRQIDLVEQVKLKPDVVAFMRTVKIWANPKETRIGPGHYSRMNGIDLRMPLLGPNKPILLHELLHAFHDQELPSGFANADIERFYQRGQSAGWPQDSYMMSNHREFFATTASVYLYGDIPRPPESRKQLRAKQPQYYQWLADLFDDGLARP
jgi:hypothetical protein